MADILSEKDLAKVKELLKQIQGFMIEKKYEDAKKLLQEVLKLDPNNAVAYNHMGTIYLAGGKQARAERYFKKALELSPDMEDAEENLQSLVKLKMKRGTTDDRTDVKELETQARKLIEMGQTEEAVECLKRVIEADPTNVKVHNNIGILYFQKGMYEKAEKFFVKALETYFQHGMAFDDQYTLIKENLARLREKLSASGGVAESPGGGNISFYVLSRYLEGEEEIKTVVGAVPIKSQDTFGEEYEAEIKGVLSVSTRRVILYYKGENYNNGEAVWVDIAHNSLNNVTIFPGILKTKIVINTTNGEFEFVGESRNDMRETFRILEQVKEKALSAKKQLTLARGESIPGSGDRFNDLRITVAFTLLDLLKEIDVMTEEEVNDKKADLLNKKSEKDPHPPGLPTTPSLPSGKPKLELGGGGLFKTRISAKE